MNINVKYFASLRERMGCEEQTVEIDADSMTVADLWDKYLSSDAMPSNVLVAVNMEYTDPSHTLKDGDEVAFFPPVTGG
jgi:molybdopterin synthase sulfur carrier subunit